MNCNPNRIREIRRMKKLSGTEMAKKLDISAPYYYDIEKGERNLSAELAAKIADIFGVSVDYLIGRENEDDDNEQELLKKLDLSDEALLKEFELTLDGVAITKEEAKNLIAFLRTTRQINKK